METSLFVDNALVCFQLDHRAAHLRTLCRERQITPKKRFHPVFRFHAMWAEVCNMPWRIAHEPNLCSVWTSYTGESWKRPFLCIMRNFGYNWHTEMRFLVERFWTHVWRVHWSCHIWWVLCFLSAKDIWWTKDDTAVQDEQLCTCFMDTRVHENELCTFWTSQTYVSGKLSFFCIMHEIGHSSIT